MFWGRNAGIDVAFEAREDEERQNVMCSGLSDVDPVSLCQAAMPFSLEALQIDPKALTETLAQVLPLSHASGHLTQGFHSPIVDEVFHGVGRKKIGRQWVLIGSKVVVQIVQGGQTALRKKRFSLFPNRFWGISVYEPQGAQIGGGALDEPESISIFDEPFHDLMLKKMDVFMPQDSLNEWKRRAPATETTRHSFYCQNFNNSAVGKVSGFAATGEDRDDFDSQAILMAYAQLL